ncbi:MAG: hypothetical protein V1720_11950 [bacterium]
MKKIFLILLLLAVNSFGQFRFGEAKGLFLAAGVGPRFPIGDGSDDVNIGAGFDFEFSYTDNEYLPVFIYMKIGYQHNPGQQGFYKVTDYSSYSSNSIILDAGIKYFFPPIIKDVVILMPVAMGGFSFGYFENYHQFKIGIGRDNFVEEVAKTGFHIGGGFSMFLMDVAGYYNYFEKDQFLSFDLSVRIPIFVKF